MTLPNAITILRILLVPPFVILLLRRDIGPALGVFAVASISDLLDGYLARKLKRVTRIGAFLDPLADKLLAGSAFILLAVREVIPEWLTVIVLSRELLLLLGFYLLSILQVPIEVAPSRVGKVNTALQLGTVCVALVTILPGPWRGLSGTWPLFALFVATAVTTIVSGAQYLLRGLRKVN
ncbi:MAG: CDP-diacylglycerol--glycerol-3-phosphate 3-phosphatidyltransferase [Deltaproteobacteria bacterium RBG_13_65_10]|jgi:cardiolipin synthase|nr:MAG: CDP-diacylglycerol--glycerol-3-phosphate 3-phosphatidyltransferase [Deltaproteobacteria bacterium RBG_13_65_10]